MKSLVSLLSFMSLFLLLTAMQCDDDDTAYNCEDSVAYLTEQKLKIENMAKESICGGAFECRYIAFGSKPCGGPWEFLIYTTSIDTLALKSLVSEYNRLEANYNLNCGAASDCSVPQPPIGFNCENDQCNPMY